MISHQQFIDKRLGKSYEETPAYGAQCVALAKLYVKEVQWVTLGSFGWSAFSWRNNSSGTFNRFYKTVNQYWDAGQMPKVGDVIFFKPTAFVNPYGHVAIVNDPLDWLTVSLIEQNGGKGTGTWRGVDAIRIQEYGYKNILWRYSLTPQAVEEDVAVAPVEQVQLSEKELIETYIQNIQSNLTALKEIIL